MVHSLKLPEEVLYWYAPRFHVETLFSDQKSWGFNLHRSHLRVCQRLARLRIAVCLAYIEMVCLGVMVMQ